MMKLNNLHNHIGATSLLCAALLSACSVVESSPSFTDATPAGLTGNCESEVGSYTLPKTVLRVRYQEYLRPEKADLAASGFDIETAVIGDGDPMCLDYIGVPTASDDLRIFRGSSTDINATDENIGAKTGILQVVTNKSTDYSGVILRKIVRTIFTVLSGDAEFQPVGEVLTGRKLLAEGDDKLVIVDVLDLMVDPLDPDDLAQTNAILAKRGLCLVISSYSFDPTRMNANAYCKAPEVSYATAPPIVPELTIEPEEFKPSTPGLLYRPRRTYNVLIFGKAEPNGPGDWRLIETEPVQMENLSPVFSLGIDRAMFAEARTAILFEDGDLKAVCTTKGSEALGFIEIPLEVVRSIVRLPTAILKVDINDVLAQQKLADAEQRLLVLQDQLLRKQQDLDPANATAKGEQNAGKPPEFGEVTFNAPTAPTITEAQSFLKDICLDGDDSRTGGI